jgi:SulP family sulfate permease
MATLAAILFIVAWGMSEYERFISLFRMPNGDRAVLLLTFGLTVFVDLAVAIGVGVTLASLLFMMRMSEAVQVQAGASDDPDDNPESDDAHQRDELPAGVEVFRINGPFFFGVANDLLDTLRRVGQAPRVIILRMRLVPLLDASGVTAVEAFVGHAKSIGAQVILSGVQPQPASMLTRVKLGPETGQIRYAPDYRTALSMAKTLAANA